jgi:replicative DNA helicase
MHALINIINRIQKIRNPTQNLYSNAIKSEIEILNRILNGGFINGNLYVLAGRESVGKTSFVVSLISDIISNKIFSHKAGLILLNISEVQWIERLLANISGVWLEKIKRGRLESHDFEKINDLSRLTQFEKIEISAQGYMNIREVISTCTRYVLQKDVQIIFIDYLQLISVENMSDGELKLFTVCKALKNLSIELNVPIIILVPLKSGKAVSDLKDLRNIGAIEPFADVIMFLNKRVNNIPKNWKSKEEIYLTISKNNTGLLDTLRLRALLHIQKFVEFDY